MKGGGGSVAVLSVARPKVNFMCAASGSRCYFRNVPYLSFSLCLSRQFCHRKTGKKRCWKKYTHAFFLQLIRSNRFFFLKRRHKAKCSGAASKEYKVQQNPFLSWFCLEQRNTPVHHTWIDSRHIELARKIQPEGSIWNLCVRSNIYFSFSCSVPGFVLELSTVV